MVRKNGAQTLAGDVFDAVRRSILAGRFGAGERLLPTPLAAEHGVSPGAMREALIRLSATRLVEVAPNRGFTVARVDERRLRDLLEMRVLNETAAVRLAVRRADRVWQASVVAAFDRLEPLAYRPGNEAWFAAHRGFHERLVGGCGNPALAGVCDDLLQLGELHLRWLARASSTSDRRPGSRSHRAEHAGIVAAVLARDGGLAAARYESHLRLTVALALDNLAPADTAEARDAIYEPG